MTRTVSPKYLKHLVPNWPMLINSVCYTGVFTNGTGNDRISVYWWSEYRVLNDGLD